MAIKGAEMIARLTSRPVAILAAGLLLALVGAVPLPLRAQRGNAVVEYKGRSPDQMIAAFMKKYEVPGMALAIVQAPYITRIVGYGIGDLDKRLLVSSNTVFPLGGVTRAYTGVAILQLVEAGKLKLDDPVGKSIKGLPETWAAVPIRWLLMHASGIPEYVAPTPADQILHGEPTPMELLRPLFTKPAALKFEPGTMVQPSATNALLLEMVVEALSGKSFQDFIWEGQITRAGLTRTFFLRDLERLFTQDQLAGGKTPSGHSEFLKDATMINPIELALGISREKLPTQHIGPGYNAPIISRPIPVPWTTNEALKPEPAIAEGVINQPVFNLRQMGPPAPPLPAGRQPVLSYNDLHRGFKNLPGSAMLYASAADISKWDIALAGEILIKDPALRQVLYTPGKLKNDQAVPTSGPWSFPGRPGLMIVEGSAPAENCSAFLSRYTAADELLCVTLLANKANLNLAPLAREIAAAFDERLVLTAAPAAPVK